ncbi:MAG: polysulfide reductase NrfD [Chloroflexi bacterium]|nr:polysulfide reductase NrfD [Chloroflexota bacterium]
MKPEFDWGTLVIWYFFLGGVAGGAYLTATLAELFGEPGDREMAKVGYTIAFPLVLVCAVLLIADLGHPERFWELLFTTAPVGLMFKAQSPIQIGGYALLGFGLFSFLSLLDVWVEEGRLKFAPLRGFYNAVPRKLYAGLGALFGFFLAGYTGVLLNTTAQAAWAESPFIGALFVASAASTGAAAIALVMALRRRPEADTAATRLTRMDNAAIVIEVVIVLLVLATGTTLASGLLSGAFALWFWAFVATGIIVPLVLQMRASLGGAHLPANLIVLASALVLIGGLIIRYAIVMVAQT